MKVEGKVAVVIGGARGIGRAYVEGLLANGAKVYIGDVLEDVADEAVKQLSEKYADIGFQKCDITKESDVRALFAKTEEKYEQKVEIYLNSSGVLDEFDYEKTIEINFSGVVRSTYVAYEFMSLDKGGKGGVIVHTASMASLKHNVFNPVYSATKHAVHGFIMSWGQSKHFERTGVRTNCICPGFVATEMGLNITKVFFADEIAPALQGRKSIPFSQLSDAALALITEDKYNGDAMCVTLTKGNFIHDKTREDEYQTVQ